MKLHGDKYTYPAYKVWARMIKNSQWDKMDDPPPIKMISGKSAKKDKDSVADIIAGAAVAVVQALKNPSPSPPQSSSFPQDGISPGKKVNLRQQYLQQLKMIQNLRDDGILIASFPGPAQLSVASSTEKRERAWNNSSRE